MSKFRPIPTDCIYVIPDIHGRSDELQLILDRIIPLRNNINAKDKLIFLGDYIDRGNNSPKVLDILIDLHKKYRDQVVFLKGNHESLLLMSVGRDPPYVDPFKPSPYSVWFKNGGDQTILQYANLAGLDIKNAGTLSQDRAISIINSEHINFLYKETILYHEIDQYVFVHAGCDPFKPLNEQDSEVLMWDRSLFEFVKRMHLNKTELPWDKTIITGHNYTGPYIDQNGKFMMLDCSTRKKLLLLELNSMTGFYAGFGKKRLVKAKLT